MIIDGKKIAQEIIGELKSRPAPKKFLAAVLVGSDQASINFLKQKEKTAKELGIDFRLYKFPEELKNDDLRKEVLKIAGHKTCGGAIVQLPLPEHINKHYIVNAIPREKDVDVLGERALGAFYTGRRNPVLPPAVETVRTIVENCKLKIENSRVAVVGRGFLVGKPIAVWLMDKARELAVFGSKADLSELKSFDVVISGIGKDGTIKPEMLKENALVIDFGYNPKQMANGKWQMAGDFDSELLAISPKLLAINYTPVPGGTGPILVTKLLENFYKLNSE